MKVISGLYKGRNIEGFQIDGTRPTMERVKESLFAMIQDYVKDGVVLDLFSGSGNLGIEALSEGASYAYLCDYNTIAYKTIEKNLKTIGIENARVLKMDYSKALSVLKEEDVVFDVIFLDPPYQTNYIEKSIQLIDEYNLIKKDKIIVCESDKLDRIVYSNNYEVLKEKKYGDKFVVILKKM